jgi:hypothetical protein
MARAGRKRKAGPRHPNGRLRQDAEPVGREAATPERAAKAAEIRQVAGEFAGEFASRVTSMPELLRAADVLTQTQVTVACEYVRLSDAAGSVGTDSPLAQIGMPRTPNKAAPREMSEKHLARVRSLRRLRSAAPPDALPIADGVLLADLAPRRPDQIARLRRCLDAMGLAMGLQPEPAE